MSYHRQKIKAGKTLWAPAIAVAEEADFFETSDDRIWSCDGGNHWWIAKDGARIVGKLGERVAFFPRCGNHPGPWHGYPVSPANDEHYEVPEEVISKWESGTRPWIDDLVAGRIRKGKI
ncbi:MAG: hypothetical protein V4610_03615 [Pseudomonadota bacterium]|jgi:hypothetical protein